MPRPKYFENVLAAQNGAYEPQRQFQYMLTIPGLGAGGDVLSMSVSDAALPSLTLNETEIPHKNSKVYVTGKVNFETTQISFYDYVDKNTYKILLDWWQQIYNLTAGEYGYAKDYKKLAYLHIYTPDWRRERTWKYEGMWITTLDAGSLDYSSDEPVKINATFRYDRAMPLHGLSLRDA